MRRAPRATALLAGLLSLAAGGGALAQGSAGAGDPPVSGPVPRPSWLTLQTQHFELHFYPEERAFAERSAHVAERAYRLITRYLNWRPSGRVSISLFDHTDTANGGATSIPYNHIYAYGVAPEGMDELSDYDDFVKLLVTHEFTHVVHLDTILSWCPRLVNTIFGKIYAPNLSQPNWFIEGLAVLMESRQTTAGRLRSSFQQNAPARPVPRRAAARVRSGQRRRRAVCLPARQRPLPVRRQHPVLSREPLRPGQGPRDSRSATPTSASRAASTASPRRRSGARTPTGSATASGKTGSARCRTGTRWRSKKPSSAV